MRKYEKKYIFALVGVVIAFVAFVVLFAKQSTSLEDKVKQENKVTKVEEKTEKYSKDFDKHQEDTEKAENFIVGMLPDEDSLVDFHFEDGHDHEHDHDEEAVSQREETLIQFLSALNTKNIPLFTGAFESKAISDSFSKGFSDYTPDGMNKEYLRILTELTKEDTFVKGDFVFTGRKEGVLTLTYKEGSYETPFTLNEYEDGHGQGYYYLISTPISEILKNINLGSDSVDV